MLCAYAHRLVSLEDAEEIVQEVMLWLWENRGDLIIESSLNQYLFKMTYRRVLNHLTREQVKTKAEAAFMRGHRRHCVKWTMLVLRNWTGK